MPLIRSKDVYDRPPVRLHYRSGIDDYQRILESFQNLLESADHAVRPFASAATLLEGGCLAEIDCLISDIDMPIMDGFELLRVVRATRPELLIILITGHPDMLNRLPSMGTGHHRLFKNPFDGQELLTAVSDALRNGTLVSFCGPVTKQR